MVNYGRDSDLRISLINLSKVGIFLFCYFLKFLKSPVALLICLVTEIPESLLKAILPLLEPEPIDRPTAEELCNSPIFSKFIKKRQV